MNITNLLYYFQSWGMQVKPSEVRSFYCYVNEMLKRDRVLIMDAEDGMEAILFYFITDDVHKFDNRPVWSTPEDSERGSTIFIDKMVARKWTKPLRVAVQDAIESRYPFIERAFWLREPLNRNVIINRRGTHVHS